MQTRSHSDGQRLGTRRILVALVSAALLAGAAPASKVAGSAGTPVASQAGGGSGSGP